MLLQEVLTVPQTGNAKVDTIAQLSILGLSLGSVFIAAWRKQNPPKKTVRRKTIPPVAPLPRSLPRKALDELSERG